MEAEKNIKKADFGVLAGIEEMLSAPDLGIGPDVVIVVSSCEDGASFWQKRLTGADGVHGSGGIVKPSAVVLSVSESNWHGSAGNALGTINAFYEAGRMAMELGLVRPSGDDIDRIFSIFSNFLKDKSAFMFHTAGKGTRLSPLTAAEHNSKSRIKLPGMVHTREGQEPITVLEAAIRAAGICAPTREGRLSVFWGDQILLNERNVRSDNTHHIEIFAQPTELDESIRSYGVIIPSGAGECRLREKLRPALIKKLFPDAAGNIYRSIGSFSITLEAFGAFAASEKKAAIMRSGELNTDSGWWQALTSEMEEYVDLLSDKGLSRAKAEKRWKKTRKVRDQLVSAGKNVSPRKELIGFVDTGAGSLWIDCGRSSSLFENMLLLTKNTPEAVAARKFFGLDREFQVSSDARGLISENSAVIASKVGRGRLKNCVVVASDIAEAEAEDSVIIGSVVTRLNAGSALCYNVVSSREKLGKGDVAVNVFHPDRGRIVMKTHVTRDGQEDWAKKVRIGENSFSYPELSDLVGGVSEEDIKKARMSAVKAVKKERKNNAEHS